jgi:hypothetical protein
MKVSLNRILAGKAADLPLVDGDILYIPNSRGKEFLDRAGYALVPAMASAATYRAF